MSQTDTSGGIRFVPDSSALVSKLAKIMAGLGRVPKRGRNEFHKYDYVMEADLADAVREDLAKAGIMMVPSVLIGTEKWFETEKGGRIYSALFAFRFTDGNSTVDVVAPGCGHDNPGDKAPYKAMTGAEKYAIMKLFLIPTGDDPEAEKEDTSNVGRSGHAPAQPARGDSGGRGSAGGSGTVHLIPFGNSKGKALPDVDDGTLAWYTKVCEEQVAKNDPKWGARNKQALEACQAEWGRRNPWRRHWQAALKLAQKAGLGEAALIDLLKEITGKTKASEMAESDVAALKAKIEEIEKELDFPPGKEA